MTAIWPWFLAFGALGAFAAFEARAGSKWKRLQAEGRKSPLVTEPGATWPDQSSIKVVYYYPDDDEGPPQWQVDRAWRIAKDSEINILSDKDLKAIALVRGQVAGAMFDALVQNSYSFDVVVDSSYRGIGVGSRLLDVGLDEFRELQDEGVTLDLHVVNPHMHAALLRRGIEVEEGSRYVFLTDCVGWRNGEDINDMKAAATSISRRAFLRRVDPQSMADRELSLGYEKRASKGLTMAADRHVGYFASTFLGVPCVYFAWSGIENIFVDSEAMQR